MDRAIDLDEAAAVALARLSALALPGMRADALSWRDADQAWPQRLVEDRRLAADPDSLGLRVSRGEQEGSLVLFRGGWAELTYVDCVNDADPINDVIGWDDPLNIASCGELVDRFFSLFRSDRRVFRPRCIPVVMARVGRR